VCAALAWAAGYLLIAVAPGRWLNGPSMLSNLWMIPASVVLVVLPMQLSRDQRFSVRDRLPWRLIMVGGLLMTCAEASSLLSDAPIAILPTGIAGFAGMAPMLALVAATVLFRRATDTGSKPRLQDAIDHIAVVLASALALWYFVFEPVPSSSGAGLASQVGCGILALCAIAFLARLSLRPMTGLSPQAAAAFFLGGMVAIFGSVAMFELGTMSEEAGAVHKLSFTAVRLALIVGCRLELRYRRRNGDTGQARGPSPLFFAAIAIGSTPLALLVLNLGSRYFVIVAGWLCLSGMVAVRQYFAARDAISANDARRKTEARFGWLVRNSSDFIMAVDAAGVIDYVSPSVERLLRSPAHSLLGTPLTDLAHPEDVGALGTLINQAMAQPGRRVSGEWRLRQANDTWLPVETVASSGTGDPDTTGVVLNTRDLQERKALEQKLTFQAFHDPLTRLANRNLFRERVQHALDRRNVSDIAVLFIDLDNFKTINDSLGHAAGDHVLVETAHRIRSTLRTEDTAARLGGDEFAVLLEDADVTGAARVAERIRGALGTPFWVLGQEVYISASIGIAIRCDGDAAGELLRNADVAMYTAKSKGKACFEIFEPAMHDVVVARLGMEAELRRALERGEFVVYYQPIVKLETGEIIGAEALVRWQHPTRGLVPPLEFIPLAEETGLIIPLGGWILRQACRQLAEWQKLRGSGDPFVMNVNLSSRQLMRDVIADEVAAAVDESGIRASWLVLEVTETVLMADPVAAAIALKHIRDLGVRVALDDFGSGYSSLSHLRRFPIDIVKIDKSFVDDVAREGAQSAIARGIIELGRAMSIQTVAEGIEADDQAEILRSLGCDLGQGFFFARPLAAEAWAGLLGPGSREDGATGRAAAISEATASAHPGRRQRRKSSKAA
jgi:diguanylate cyclase (GGDEF)-like protein/PAS domain S-box-containing protein